MVHDEIGHRGVVVERQRRQSGFDGGIGGHGDDVVAFGEERRLAVFRAVDFELGHRFLLETFDQHEVTGRQVADQFVERRLRFIAPFVHERPAVAAGEQHLGGPGFAMAVGILARLVDVETVVGVLDDRHLEATRRQLWDELFQQGRLAGTGITGDTENFHGRILLAQAINTGAKPPPGVRKLVVWPWYRRAATSWMRPA